MIVYVVHEARVFIWLKLNAVVYTYIYTHTHIYIYTAYVPLHLFLLIYRMITEHRYQLIFAKFIL